MTQSAVRTTSLAASAALMSALVIAALTMSVTFIPQFGGTDAPIIDMAVLPPPTPPAPTPPRQPMPPQARPIEGPQISTLPPIEPLRTSDAGETILGPPQPETITRPRWVRVPSNLQGYYPRRALQRGMEGDVVLDCLVTTTGTLQCGVVSETPVSWDFGAAALRISQDYQMVPAMRAGQPVEGRYRMRVPFRID